MKTVAVLFARADSIYKTLPGVEVYDEARDARTYDGPHPVVAHPPCRAWGQLAHMAKPAPHEKDLARFAVSQVRKWGGVLEHPKKSRLWADQGLPLPERRDAFGGFTLPVYQSWWGHRAEKATLLYIVGIEPRQLPPLPYCMGETTHVIASSTARQRRTHPGYRPEVTKAEREHTPADLAVWLVELARRSHRFASPAASAANSVAMPISARTSKARTAEIAHS